MHILHTVHISKDPDKENLCSNQELPNFYDLSVWLRDKNYFKENIDASQSLWSNISN